MHFESRLALLALGFCPLASGQLSSIGVLASSETAPSSSLSTLSTASVSTVTSTSTASSSTSAASSSTPPTTAAPTPSTTGTGDELALTTVFTQPAGCDTGITAVPSWTSELWQNIVNPVPTLTLTSCYPSQFYYSAVATALLPPYSQLVCPKNWESYNVTETYLICCPRYVSFPRPK
ncbi:hypothetical protein EIK77_000145 [Talaromyces pinophilus]|nr:hypothetical protein EIK77_000145 [Talaromyces pinophilus]